KSMVTIMSTSKGLSEDKLRFARLTEKELEAYRLFMKGMSVTKIAERLKKSKPTVSILLKKARSKIDEYMQLKKQSMLNLEKRMEELEARVDEHDKALAAMLLEYQKVGKMLGQVLRMLRAPRL
ncbi:MAG: LuxR C-terminal-related transcriptional regulator, partial [Nitrososphaerota archaeon]